MSLYNLQEAPDSYACLHQSAANRTKSTNISKCKKYVQTWCNFQGKRTAGAEIYLNWAIKGTNSFTPPVKLGRTMKPKCVQDYPGRSNKSNDMCKVGTKTPVCANTGQNQKVSNSVFSVSSYILRSY